MGRSAPPKSGRARIFVWSFFFFWSALLLALPWRYGHNLPSIDGWEDTIPAYTGEQPFTWEYLWSSHNGHRMVIQRTILHFLLTLSHGNFKIPQYFNALCLIAMCALLLGAMTRIRGRASYSDVFFPLLLLGWSHYGNILTEFQVQFLFSSLLVGVALAQFIGMWRSNRATIADVVTVTVCGLLLPLCGFNGVVYGPPFALWLLWMAWRYGKIPAARAVAGIAGAGGAAILSLSAAYFWHLQIPNMGKDAAVSPLQKLFHAAGGTVQFLTVGLGVAAVPSNRPFHRSLASLGDLMPLLLIAGTAVFFLWKSGKKAQRVGIGLGVGIFLLLLLRPQLAIALSGRLPFVVIPLLYAWAGLWLLRQVTVRRAESGQDSWAGLLAVLTGSLLIAVATGAGRGSVLLPRYMTIASPGLCALFTIFSLAALKADEEGKSSRFFKMAPIMLLVLVAGLTPISFNRLRSGLPGSVQRERLLAQEASSGTSAAALVAQYKDLFPGRQENWVLREVERMHAARVAPFRDMAMDPLTQSFSRSSFSDLAQDVPLPEEKLSLLPGTVQNGRAETGGVVTSTTPDLMMRWDLPQRHPRGILRVRAAYPTIHQEFADTNYYVRFIDSKTGQQTQPPAPLTTATEHQSVIGLLQAYGSLGPVSSLSEGDNIFYSDHPFDRIEIYAVPSPPANGDTVPVYLAPPIRFEILSIFSL